MQMIATPAQGRLAVMVLAAAITCASLAGAAPAVWKDDATGFALAGFDPVAYYTQRRPARGATGIEHNWGGVVWRFVNAGNKAAFSKHPQAYAPLFAGYDPEALSRGLTVKGSPAVWSFHKGRIVLFRDRAAKRTWQKAPGRLSASAAANWKRLSRDVPGTSRY